jgi:hypothetical protein
MDIEIVDIKCNDMNKFKKFLDKVRSDRSSLEGFYTFILLDPE